MSNFQIQIISLGGAIGLGSRRLQAAGPTLLLVYAATGVVAYLLMRAIGELVMHRSSVAEQFGDRRNRGLPST